MDRSPGLPALPDTPSSPGAEPQSPHAHSADSKRLRVSRACDRCRRKKVKCDARRPVCNHCEALSLSCTYLDTAKKRGPPKGYIEAIENRLHKVEELLKDLVLADSSAARHVLKALQGPDFDDVAVVTDPSGKLFGAITLLELEARAALCPARGQIHQLPVPEPGGSPGYQRSEYDAEASAAVEAAGWNGNASMPAIGVSENDRTEQPPNHRLECVADDCVDDDCSAHLTRLEKGVGHLTLDPTGSLRYLGDSSGWYIINRSLVSSEASPRLTKAVDGAFRWPPITSIPSRDAEFTASPLSAGRPGAAVHATKEPEPVPNDALGCHSSISGAPCPDAAVGSESKGGAACSAGQNATASPTRSAELPFVVSVPRNMPPSGKPPMPDAEEEALLLTLYFRYVQPVFPILYKSYFLERVQIKENRPSPSLLSAVFAAASTYKAREARTEEEMAHVRIQMAVHFQRAKLYLDEQYTLNTTASILTLLLMSVYEQGTMSTRSWLYSGMAIRKAYDLGLHRDVGATKHNGLSVLSRTETEVRQRAWWGCYIMDIMVSATLGRPTTIRDFTFDVPFPADYGEDSDELTVASSINASPAPTNTSGPLPVRARPAREMQMPSCLRSAACEPTLLPGRTLLRSTRKTGAPMAVAERMVDYVALTVGKSESDESDDEADEEFGERPPQGEKPLGVYYLDLLHILGHILTEMYACKPNRGYVAKFCLHDLHSRIERLIILDHELRQWKLSLPPSLLYPVDDIIAIKPARCVYIALIHLVYYTAMILLHRPFISRLGEPPIHATALHTADSPLGDDVFATDTNERQAGTGFDHYAGCQGESSNNSHTAQPNTTSPLPSHSICTVSAQMITLIGQAIIQDSRIFIMPFLTFMMFTAGTMHLNNVIVAADSWIARRFLKRTLEVMSRLGAHWQVSYKCYTMLNALVRANRIGLDQVTDDSEASARAIKERCRETSRIAYAVFENRAMYREWNPPAKPSTTRLPAATHPRPSMSRYTERATSASNLSAKLGERRHGESTADEIVSRAGQADSEYLDTAHTAIPQVDRTKSNQTPRVHPSSDLETGRIRFSTRNTTLAGAQDPGLQTASALNLAASSPVATPPSSQIRFSQQTRSTESSTTTGIRNGFLDSRQSDPGSDAFGFMQPPRDVSGFTQSVKPMPHLAKSVAASLFSLRNKVDVDGMPIVPASPYTSVELSRDLMLPTRTHVVATDAPVTAMNVSAAVAGALGQFVPSLEFFANADFPLGIGGPNGQASLDLSLAMASHSSGTAPSSRHATASQTSLRAPPSLFPATTASLAGTPGRVDANSATPFNTLYPGRATCSYGGIDELTDLVATSLAGLPSGNAVGVFGSPATNAMGGLGYNSAGAEPMSVGTDFSDMLIDDNVIRNLPFTGPVSYDLGLAGSPGYNPLAWTGPSRGPRSIADVGGSAAAPALRDSYAHCANAAALVPHASETPWRDYVNQVIRMFNADRFPTDSDSNNQRPAADK